MEVGILVLLKQKTLMLTSFALAKAVTLVNSKKSL